jgi:hypothetical protein
MWSSGRTFAQVALDVPTNTPYLDGWQEGDDGGVGFGPWSFGGSYNAPSNSIHLINPSPPDSAHPENDLGTAWTLSLDFDPDPSDDIGFGLARAGRALDAPLQVGQTVSIVFDNPTAHRFFKGYTVSLMSGTSNSYPQNTDPPTERFGLWSFNYDPSRLPDDWPDWRITPSPNPHYIPLTDEDTDAGARLEFTLTGLDSYSLKVTPLDQPANAFTTSGLLAGRADFDNSSGGVADGKDFLTWQRNFGRNAQNSNPDPGFAEGDANGDGGIWVEDFPIWASRFGGGGEINWIQFTHYDELRDPVLATDFYISSLQVVNGPPPTSAIPEPNCIFMALIGMMGAVCVRHRRRTIIPSASDLDHSMSRIIS